MKYYTHSERIMGTVKDVDPANRRFSIKCLSGDVFDIYVGDATYYQFIINFDRIDRNRIPEPEGYVDDPEGRLSRYIQNGMLAAAYGIKQVHEDKSRFDAREITLFHDEKGQFLFEGPHYWIAQISALADEWIDNLFGLGSTFDYTQYQTNLTYIGSKVENNKRQECATLSRLLYGLSSAYLMTGNDRYYRAAKAGVEYQRDTFRMESYDGSFVVWAYGYENGQKIIPTEGFGYEEGTIPLYEQIYALAGLTQFYRISNDWETLNDIKRTMNFFKLRFKDNELGGYFSHVDPATMWPDTPALGRNCAKKNWNSIGDHTPAYLLNLLLAIDNIPSEDFTEIFEEAMALQEETADLIADKFPDPNPNIPYVQERFYRDWSADKTYDWQQDRAVIGHNLKIAWNLSRVYSLFPKQKYIELATKLGDDMKIYGLDQVRGGCFDVVEREPKNGMPFDFTWHNRKAWWQQEQGILAYLILYGVTGKQDYLDLARHSTAFWSMSYLDFDYGDVYFDVIDDGLPYTKGEQAFKGGHSKSGYHVFELNFLAQIYSRTFVSKVPFRLYFKLCPGRKNEIINVMPDYLPKESLIMGDVFVNGAKYTTVDRDDFRIQLESSDEEVELVVEFIPNKDYKPGGK